MEPEDVPAAMVEAAKKAMREDGWTCEYHEPVTAIGECGQCDRSHDATAHHMLAAALSVCDVHLETGIVFDDEPNYLHIGSSYATEIMSRQASGGPLNQHPGRRWMVRTPVERNEANDTAG